VSERKVPVVVASQAGSDRRTEGNLRTFE
jgi:hypothetical protein